MSYTLRNLLETYKVVIPQIQRDYAQGRENEYELRKGFVNKIKNALSSDGEKLNLDFIYGYTEKTGSDKYIFVPLDGQQRLSTLWLAHWLLAPRIENEIIQEVKVYLSQFTYETRMSSKRFCKALINNILIINNDFAVRKQIIDAPWFMASWNSDPTVSAMLNMLDALQTKFIDCNEAWENLTQNNNITFDFIDIKSDEFKLTDELYIKMNSRGKPLTPFENFKAQFSGLLASKETDYENITKEFNHTQVSYQQYFAFKIDSVWMDLFWSYRIKTSRSVDESIYRFINFLAEFLFFRDNPDASSGDIRMDFEFLNNVYSKKQNIDFLFDSLDFLSSLDDVKSFFDELFKGLSTFDESTNDYFLRAITNTGFEVKDRTILYAILTVCNMKIDYIGNQLKDFIRVVRNLLFTVRQPNQSKRIEYTTNLRLPNVSEYCRFIDAFAVELGFAENKSVYEILSVKEFSGFTRENIANEKIKASLITNNPDLKGSIHKLEEHADLQGNLSNFKLNTSDIAQKIDAFLTIWDGSVDNSLIIRSLLSIGDYSVMTHEYSSLGEIWYFGSKESWNRILTTGDKEERIQVSSVLDKFLSEFCDADGVNTSEKLQYLIDGYIAEERGWLYYFVKYPTMTDNPYRNQNLNLFTWQGEGFEINNLGNSGKQPLHSYHLNPYLTALRLKFKDDEKLTLYWGRFTDSSYIKVEKKIRIKCDSSGWIIAQLDDFVIANEIVNRFCINEKNNSYILAETDVKDRIEIAVDFVEEIINQRE
ncbi:DUF262 domain-containing protein [Chryseobacterium viscerum]|uniref:DUF262 domain-containing protein n=1 Tax=Chryseobacterium viscerum TaxID=1037377 RepID=A0A5N4BSM4_9FLAO|nr:DUF262 domain-containing protein [Chryseobacterium viscerum]KAB1231416.1 DUF262 domain-containing protein [Chryseobacterium viscerum]